MPTMRYHTHCLDCSTGPVINGLLDYLTLSWRALPKHRSGANKVFFFLTLAKHFFWIVLVNIMSTACLLIHRVFFWSCYVYTMDELTNEPNGRGRGAQGCRRPLRIGLFLNRTSLYDVTSEIKIIYLFILYLIQNFYYIFLLYLFFYLFI